MKNNTEFFQKRRWGLISLRTLSLVSILIAVLFTNAVNAQETIKSASEYDYPPFSIVTATGEAGGFSVELLRASLNAVGLDVEFYVGPWAKIKQDLAHGKIQVLPLVGRTFEREKIYDFSVPYQTSYGGIFVRTDETRINTVKDLADKEILVMKGDNAEEFLLRENVSKHIITTESFEDAFKMLSEGKHDAIVAQQIVGRQLIGKLGITNVKKISRIDKYKQDWTFAVKEGDKELLANLNDGLSKVIINGTFDIIHDKWFGSDPGKFLPGKEEEQIPLTAREQAWIKEHPEITLGGGISFEPFIMYDDDGKVIGYDADILNLVAKRTGLNIRFELGKWNKILDRARKRELDGLTSAILTKERAPIYNRSKQYLSYTSLIIVKKGNPAEIHSIEDISGKRVALQKGNAFQEILSEEGKKVEFVYFDTIHELIKAIVSGKADFTILDESAFYVARQLMLESMIEAPFTVGDENTIHFLLRKDWPELVSIINKGINSISDEKRNSIKNKWFGLSNLEIKNVEKGQFSYAKKIIKQKAEDVARQVEIYLSAYPDKTLKDLQNDPKFQKIAIQPVGKTGYTAVSDYNDLVVLFHPNNDLIGLDFEGMSKDYPVMWELLTQAKGGHDVSGKYEFPDLDGAIKDKYVYIKIVKEKTSDGVGLWVAATTYLDEYDKIKLQEERKGSLPTISMVWVLGGIVLIVLFLLILNKLNIVKFEKNIIMLFLATALLLIIGLFIFNAFKITKNLKTSAIENYFDILRSTASNKHATIEQHINHMKNSFHILNYRKAISNKELLDIVEFGEDFAEIFIVDSSGKITHSSDISHIGFSRLNDPYFKNVKEEIYIKPLYRSGTIGEILYTISAPYNKGVLVARMNLHRIHDIISKKEGLGKSGESLLAYRNDNGDAVFFTLRRFTTDVEARDIIPKEDVNIPITQALLGNEREFSGYSDYRGVPVFAVTMYIEDIAAGLVVKIDQEEALKSVSKNINQIWSSTAQIILAIIIIGIIFYFLLTYSLRMEVKNKTNALEKASKGLGERVKELNCLYRISNLAEQPNLSLENIFQSIVDFIPPAWQYPEITCSRLIIEGEEYKTNNFKETEWKQSAKIIVAGKRTGVLDVFYLEEKLECHEGPFSEEERHLINELADRLGLLLERKQAEEKIVRFGRIFENSLNEIYLFEIDTLKFVQVNPAAIHNLGYTMEELEKLTTLDIKSEISAESFAKIISPLIKEEKQRIVFTTVHKRKNQSLYDVEVHLQLLKHENKSLFAAIILDITDQKLAREEKIQLERKYRQSQKMESIGTLAGGIAHDFNNILYPIIGFTELSMQDLPKTHEVQENLQDILDGAKRARDLVKQILMFARQEKQALKPIVLKPVVEEALKLLRSSIPANIDIQSHLYDQDDYVMCDATEIHEIVMNLCTNAYHSMEENGGTIIVRLNKQNPSPDLNLSSGEYICLSVCDSGVGIPKEIIDKIFEPYLTTKELGKGSGLGLSVVHGIVANYKGNIAVESSPDKGSVFNVFLPVTIQARKFEQKLIKNNSLDGTEHILFVDDEASIVKLAIRILERLGYTVTGKESSIEALELFKEKPDEFDLVITDMAMPMLTGAELAKQIIKIQPDIPIIICTGFSERMDSQTAKSLGIKEYIKKPILTDELTSKIKEVLNQSSKG